MSPLAEGVLLGTGAAIALAASYTLQAREARRVDTAARPGAALLRRMAARPVWLAAIALTAVAFGLQVLALRRVPLAVVQPMLALALVGLLGSGARILGEPVGPREIVAVLLIVVGLTAVVAGAPARGGQVHSGPVVIALYAALVAVLVAPFARQMRSSWPLVAAAAAGDVLAALATNRLADALGTAPGLAVAWLAVAGVAGLSAITSETAALQRLPATRVAPIVMAAGVTLPVAISALDTDARWSATPGGGALLSVGVVLVGAGAALLGGSRAVAGVRESAVAGDRPGDGKPDPARALPPVL